MDRSPLHFKGNSLPSDIILIILSLLPTDSVFRFRVVCKLWHQLITANHLLFRTHIPRAPLQLTVQNNLPQCPKRFCKNPYKKARIIIDSRNFGAYEDEYEDGMYMDMDEAFNDEVTDDGDKLDPIQLAESSHEHNEQISTVQFSLITEAATRKDMKAVKLGITYIGIPDLKIFTSCDGLLYLHPPSDTSTTLSCSTGDNCNTGGYVCNPFLGEWFNIPKSGNLSRGFVCGFYFHKASNQYRLLQLSEPPPSNEDEDRDEDEGTEPLPEPSYEYEIFALGTECWRSIPSSISHLAPNFQPPVTLNDDLYWLSRTTMSNPMIIVFNMNAENFQLMQGPKVASPWLSYFNSYLVEIEGYLSFCHLSTLYDIDIWIKREGSVWEKKYSFPTSRIRLRLTDFGYMTLVPLCFHNGEVIFCRPDYGLIYYNPETDSFRTRLLISTEQVRKKGSLKVSVYRRSLISLSAIIGSSNNRFISASASNLGLQF